MKKARVGVGTGRANDQNKLLILYHERSGDAMPDLDRFAYGNPDPQDKPLDMVGTCPCGCRQAIHFGDDGVWMFDGEYFASAECFARWSGATGMEGVWS